MWLLFLGPFFFVSYGFSNWLASQSSNVGAIVFEWEQYIPFIAWTIIPYWVIDALYGISLFICTSRKELNRHAMRLLTAQIVAVICFIIFPLSFTFERPETTGLTGWLFASLAKFDQPYNQAPSLHIALLVILWALYVRHLPRQWVLSFHILAALIAISVLTTYQHHFIDVPTGALLGFFCVWLWPLEGKTVFASAQLTNDLRRWRIASYYLLSVVVLGIAAFVIGGIALWLLWPAVSLFLVALNYLYLGSAGFQKRANGEMSIAAKWLYFPYLLGAYLNSRYWTRKEPKSVPICDGVHLGRMPTRHDIKTLGFNAIVDLTAEFNKTYNGIDWHAIPNLDLLVPSKADLLKAVRLIMQLEQKGTILVTCALGYSRSALTIMAWLMLTKRAKTMDEAISFVQAQRPSIVISETARMTLADLVQESRWAHVN